MADAPSYEVLSAVHDLYTWYLRLRSRSDPPLQDTRLDSLIRGAACLLGNRIPDAAQPLLLELACELEARGTAGAELAALEAELRADTQLSEARAYALLGELLEQVMRRLQSS